MSSIYKTNYINILKKKPYLTRLELSVLLEKRDRNLDKKILQLLKSGELVSLKKGLYITPSYLSLQRGKVEEYIANFLYYPSYLSLEYVLQKEGMIPEAVYAYTSITPKSTRQFSNSLGNFIYRHLKPQLFTGYINVRFSDNYRINFAKKAKALFDFLYLRPLGRSIETVSLALFKDLRINWDNFTKEDVIEFGKYVTLSRSAKMTVIGKVLERRSNVT